MGKKTLARVTANYKQKQEKESAFRSCSGFHSFEVFYYSALVSFFCFFHETFQNYFVLEGNDFERKSFTRGSAELQNTDWKTYGDGWSHKHNKL